jgi:predicted nucleic acid-binding protein
VPHFFDTNILVYSISADPVEAAKRDRAIALLDQDDGALSVQVLQEFYVQATRPSRPTPLSHSLAVGFIAKWTRFPVQDVTLAVLNAALEIKAAHRLSYWDSAIIAAARALGCRRLYSEDLSHGREVEGVRIVDPFR